MADLLSQITDLNDSSVNYSSTDNYSDVTTFINDEEARLSIENEKRQSIAERNSYSTDTDSNEQVAPEDKTTTKEVAKGGRNMFRATKTPSKFRTKEGRGGGDLVSYDFYRNGYMETYIKEATYADGQEETGTRYKPMPEQIASIADDWKGALASIKLIDTKKSAKLNPGDQNSGQLIPPYTKFFLEGIQENQQEKMQVVETFNDFYAFFYGERPPIYTFSGHLLNLQNYNWLNEFTYYYENFWRGTKAVELGARVFLTYNYQQVQGYIISMNTNIQAATDKAAPFSFQFLVTKRLIFNQTSKSDLFSDNLLPRPTEEGVGIDTKAASFPKALTTDFLEGKAPPSSLDPDTLKEQVATGNKKIVDEKARQKQLRNERIAREASEKAAKQQMAKGMFKPLPPGGSRRVTDEQAATIRRSMGFPADDGDSALS